MDVTIWIHAGLALDGRAREERIHVDYGGSTPLDLAVAVGLDPASVGLIFINGALSSPGAAVSDGDRIEYLPHLEGG